MSPCPAADTGICCCGDCTIERVQRRLHARAASTLRRPETEVRSLVYPARLNDETGWRAVVATRDGRIYVRCWAPTPSAAAQLAIATLTGSTP